MEIGVRGGVAWLLKHGVWDERFLGASASEGMAPWDGDDTFLLQGEYFGIMQIVVMMPNTSVYSLDCVRGQTKTVQSTSARGSSPQAPNADSPTPRRSLGRGGWTEATQLLIQGPIG